MKKYSCFSKDGVYFLFVWKVEFLVNIFWDSVTRTSGDILLVSMAWQGITRDGCDWRL